MLVYIGSVFFFFFKKKEAEGVPLGRWGWGRCIRDRGGGGGGGDACTSPYVEGYRGQVGE